MRPLTIPFLIFIIASFILYPSTCRAQWEPDGLNLCSAPDRPDYSKVAADGQGGAVIVWVDFRHGTPDATLASIYAQRVDSLGNELWTPGGVRISPSQYDQLYPEIIMDTSGNAWIVFEENIPANWWEIMLQKLDSDGDPAWGSVLQLTDAPDQQYFPMICSDDAGGAGRVDQRHDGSGPLLPESEFRRKHSLDTGRLRVRLGGRGSDTGMHDK